MPMRIAVVIPAYNEAGNIGRLINETVAAVPEASLQEVIVVDDASDDETGAEIKAMLGRYKPLRYLRHGRRAGQSAALRSGVIPGMDPLSDEIWKLKPEERKRRMLAFPLGKAGEIAGKTGTATNADGKTSDVWLLLFVPGPPEHPERGVMLGFWMGKDSKAHSLGERGSTGGPGFAETGGRNWLHSAATVLAFLQMKRGLLKRGYKFRPLMRDNVLANLDGRR